MMRKIIILDLIMVDQELAIAIKDRYKSQFHQESVILVEMEELNEISDED